MGLVYLPTFGHWAWVVLGINVGKYTLHGFFLGLKKHVFKVSFQKKVQVYILSEQSQSHLWIISTGWLLRMDNM